MKREQMKNVTLDGVEYTPIRIVKYTCFFQNRILIYYEKQDCLRQLEVAQNDFPNRMKWKDAKKACADLGNGWRLPTKDELDLLYQYKDDIGNMKEKEYERYHWGSTENYNLYAWTQPFSNGSQCNPNKLNFYFIVRAVRDIK